MKKTFFLIFAVLLLVGFLSCGGSDKYSVPTAPNQNPEVFAGQTKFFTADRGDGSFDYNLDSREEQKFSNLYTCGVWNNCAFISNPGWANNYIPKCGQEHIWVEPNNCVPSGQPGAGCQSNLSSRIQACR